MWMWFLSLWGRHCSLLAGLKDAYTLVLKGYTVYSEIGVSPQKPTWSWHRCVHIKWTHTGSLTYYSSWAVYRTEFFRLNNQLTPSYRKIKKKKNCLVYFPLYFSRFRGGFQLTSKIQATPCELLGYQREQVVSSFLVKLKAINFCILTSNKT